MYITTMNLTYRNFKAVANVDQNMPGRDYRVQIEEYPGSYFYKDLGHSSLHMGEEGAMELIKQWVDAPYQFWNKKRS